MTACRSPGRAAFYAYGVRAEATAFNLILWHLIGDTDPQFPPPIPTTGYSFTIHRGDLPGYADNTGAPFESSGDHCHFGLRALDKYGTVSNQDNGFNGCIDPKPFLDGTYAQDTPRDISYSAGLLKEA